MVKDTSTVILGIAAELGVKRMTCFKWKERGHVPYRWRMPILRAATEQGLGIRYEDMDKLRTKKRRPNGH